MDHLGIQKFFYMGYCIGGCFRASSSSSEPPTGWWPPCCARRSGVGGRAPTSCTTPGAMSGRPELQTRQYEITMESIEAYLHNLYRVRPDFVYSVSREFVRSCQTPLLVMPDNTPAHPYQTSVDVAALAPKAPVDGVSLERAEGRAREDDRPGARLPAVAPAGDGRPLRVAPRSDAMAKFDLIVRGGRVIDPASGIDGVHDVAVKDGAIVQVASRIAGRGRSHGRCTEPARDPGADRHARPHLPARHRRLRDEPRQRRRSLRRHPVVDQGGAATLTIQGFRKFVEDPPPRVSIHSSRTISSAGLAGHRHVGLDGPHGIDVRETIRAIEENRDIVKGIKCHAEVGGYSRWGIDTLRLGKETSRAGQGAGLHSSRPALDGSRRDDDRPRQRPRRRRARCSTQATSWRTPSRAIPAPSSRATARCTRSSSRRSRAACALISGAAGT